MAAELRAARYKLSLRAPVRVRRLHIYRAAFPAGASRTERVRKAMGHTGYAVFLGGFTALVGTVPLAFAKSKVSVQACGPHVIVCAANAPAWLLPGSAYARCPVDVSSALTLMQALWPAVKIAHVGNMCSVGSCSCLAHPCMDASDSLPVCQRACSTDRVSAACRSCGRSSRSSSAPSYSPC